MKLTSQKIIYLTILFVSVASNEWSNEDESMQSKNKQVEPQPIRMTYDISSFYSPEINNLDRNRFKSLMDAIVNLMKKFIKVKPLEKAIIFPFQVDDCIKINVPTDDKNVKIGINNSDLHIYLKPAREIVWEGKIRPNTGAQASPCGMIYDNQERPYFGGIHIQTELVQKLDSENKFQYLAKTILHELLHILGFNSDITHKMEKKNLAFQTNGQLFISENDFLGSAKKYFGCDTLNEVPFDFGYHWNPTSFSGEVIAPYLDGSNFISIMTVMYLKASRQWPEVNENLAEFFNERQDKGCNTMDSSANSPFHNIDQDFKCKGCNSNGICNRGICYCNPRFFGEDCSKMCIFNESTQQCQIKCPPGTFVNPNNTCKETCPRGYYKEDQRCQLCDFSCSACDGPLKNNCKACQYLSHLHEQSHSCITCEYNQYLDQRSKQCKYCSPKCLSCEKQGECTACRDGYILWDRQCLSKQKFEQCSGPGCKSCDPYNPELCLTCQEGHFFKNNQCPPCRVGCAICEELDFCSDCEPGFQLHTYQNNKLIILKQICHNQNYSECIPPCYDCEKEDRNSCTSCIDGYTKKDKKCFVNQCGIGFFQVQNKCKKCNPSCKECSHNAKNCTKCSHPMKLLPGGKCVEEKSCKQNEDRQLYCNVI